MKTSTLVSAMSAYFPGISVADQKLDKKYLTRWANIYSLAMSIPDDGSFDMDTFGHKADSSPCGTAACLAGHAMLNPWFRRRGLTPEVLLDPDDDSTPIALTFNNPEFFGLLGSWSRTPFDPDFCEEILDDCDVETQGITPKCAAEIVKAYMELFWGAEAAEAAIKAVTATFSATHVIANVPWEAAA